MMIPRKRTIYELLFVVLTTCSVVWSATNGPLKRYSKNPIYFADKDDNPVWLTGIAVCCTDAVENGWPWISLDMIDNIRGGKTSIRTAAAHRIRETAFR